MADSFVADKDSFTADAPVKATPTADVRAKYHTALPGEESGRATRAALEKEYGKEAFEEESGSGLPFTAAQMGRHVMPQVPYAALGAIPGVGPVSWAARAAAAFPIGAALAPKDKSRAVEGLIASTGTLGGEMLSPLAPMIARGIGTHRYTALADQMAQKVMGHAKDLVSWWKGLPASHEGLQALLRDGEAILDRELASAAKGPRLGRAAAVASAERQATDGRAFLKALRDSGAMNPETKRLEPSAFIAGADKPGVFPNLAQSPRAKRAIEDIVPRGRQAPEEVPLPFISWLLGHARGGERLPFPAGYRRMPAGDVEQKVREILPHLLGGGLRETARDVRSKEE